MSNMENILESLFRTLEHADGRGVGLVLAAIGLAIWWVVKRIKKLTRPAAETSEPQPLEPERPRRRLPLR